MLLLALLTNVVSNTAAGVIGTPIAIVIATELGLPPRALLAGRTLWRQHEFCHAHGLSDQSAGDERRKLPVCKVRQGGRAPDGSHVASSDLVAGLALSIAHGLQEG